MERLPKAILPLTPRDFLPGTGALVLSSAIPKAYAEATSASLGHWFEDDQGLPGYQHTGPMRFPDSPREDSTLLLPDDPYFMLGNYRLTLFVRSIGQASGARRLASARRACPPVVCLSRCRTVRTLMRVRCIVIFASAPRHKRLR